MLPFANLEPGLPDGRVGATCGPVAQWPLWPFRILQDAEPLDSQSFSECGHLSPFITPRRLPGIQRIQ